MKKILFLMLAVAAVLTGCQSTNSAGPDTQNPSVAPPAGGGTKGTGS